MWLSLRDSSSIDGVSNVSLKARKASSALASKLSQRWGCLLLCRLLSGAAIYENTFKTDCTCWKIPGMIRLLWLYVIMLFLERCGSCRELFSMRSVRSHNRGSLLWCEGIWNKTYGALRLWPRVAPRLHAFGLGVLQRTTKNDYALEVYQGWLLLSCGQYRVCRQLLQFGCILYSTKPYAWACTFRSSVVNIVSSLSSHATKIC